MAPAPERVFVGLGANVGDGAATLRRAFAALDAMPGTRAVARSALYRSAPIDAEGPDFVNAVVELRTVLDPEALLRELQGIEHQFGRERPYRHAPRTLDLDLLLFGQRVHSHAVLTLPHPRLHERAFVLQPLAELAPELLVPGRGRVAALAALCLEQRVERMA